MSEHERRVPPTLTDELVFARLEELRALLLLADWLRGLRPAPGHARPSVAAPGDARRS